MPPRPNIRKAVELTYARMRARVARKQRPISRRALEALILRQKKVAGRFLGDYLRLEPGGKRKREKVAVARLRTAQESLAAAQEKLKNAKKDAEQNEALSEIRAAKRELIFNYGILKVIGERSPENYRRIVEENRLGDAIFEELENRIFS